MLSNGYLHTHAGGFGITSFFGWSATAWVLSLPVSLAIVANVTILLKHFLDSLVVQLNA